MGVTNRPYIGSWRLSQKQLVQHTPDALVYINGDTSLPGCPRCNGKIDIQQFVTEVTVDAGTDPGAMSASFTLSVPVHHNESFARDARFILRPGLEVHIYYRGYFPISGLYSNLDDPRNVSGGIQSTGEVPADAPIATTIRGTAKDSFPASMAAIDFSKVPENLVRKWEGRGLDELGGVDGQNATVVAGCAEIIEKYWRQRYPNAEVSIADHHRGPGGGSTHPQGAAIDYSISYTDESGNRRTVPALQAWAATQKLSREGRIPRGGQGLYLNGRTTTGTSPSDQGSASNKKGAPPGGSSGTHYDFRGAYGFTADGTQPGSTASWVWVDTTGSNPPGDIRNSPDSLAWLRNNGRSDVADYFLDGGASDDFIPEVGDSVPNLQQQLGQEPQVLVEETSPPSAQEEKSNEDVVDPAFSQSLLDEIGLAGFGLEDVVAYPYYHCFRGVVTQVGHSYSTGVQSISVQCSSMLHFWQYHRVSTNASLFGARPTNSKLKASVVGHNFTGMHPYEIIYNLHNDVAGSAAGVSWALSQKTNQSARSPLTGESLFSLNLKYWEQRFKSKEIKLRMHGMTGDLFSAAQAAFLGQTSSNELMSLLRNRFNRKISVRPGILQSSIALGLTRNRRLEALLAARQTREAEVGENATADLELNLIEMQAFVTNVGNWGNFNLFESTYESKMDIAQRVMEVTGFEFYQDVDGDFVFKPPMYNLDTSTARVYRIEDIDVININFNETEPQSTYMTCKGSGFKNFEGSGLEGEWGVQGQYIDYRLVAQFGWRPGDFETAYFNDPKSMFFAAINRLDIMNAPMNSATVSIPMRPEIRPGYPFYIRYLDCYYYCPSFSHSYSVGGQATTNLTLTAKRAKFYAPGDPSQRGINSIHLENPLFPQRPLEVLDNAGRPRLAGFPNVVMALDPKKINPLFLVVGSDVETMDNPESLSNLIKMGVDLHIIRPATQDDIGQEFSQEEWASLEPTLYVIDTSENQSQILYFQNPFDKSTDPDVGSPTRPSGAVDLLRAAQLYVAAQRTQATKLGEEQDQINRINERINNLNQTLRDTDPQSYSTEEAYNSRLKSISAEIASLEEERRGYTDRYTESQQDFETFLSNEQDIGIRWLVGLIKRLGEAFGKDYTARGGSDFGNMSSTTSLLDLLSNKKAAMVSNNLPGDFRYYSASHPNVEQQGQLGPTFESKSAADQPSIAASSTESPIKYRSPFLENLWKTTRVNGFVTPNEVTFPGNTIQPEARLTQTVPKWGLRVLTNNPEAPNGEVIPTSEIRELMFASHNADISRRIVSTQRRERTTAAEKPFREALQKSARTEVQRVSGTDQSILEIFEDWLDQFNSYMQLSYQKAKELAETRALLSSEASLPQISAVIIPSNLVVGGRSFNTTVDIGDNYKFSDSPANIRDNPNIPEAWPGSSKKVQLREFWQRAANEIATTTYFSMVSNVKIEWFEAMVSSNISFVNAEEILSAFMQSLGSWYKVVLPAIEKTKASDQAKRGFRIQTPVFPVSDSRGYEVFGTYRYGRDVDIEANGVFDVLHRQDPLGVLDKHTRDLILRVIVNKESLYVEVPVLNEDGTPKKDQVTGAPVTRQQLLEGQEAYDEAMKQVIAATRERFTDSQLIDLGLANKSNDPNMLEMNLMNWFSEKGKEGIQKIPINNAAYSLADMTLHMNRRICSCKMAEAEVILDAAGQNNFLDFAAPAQETTETAGTGEEDRPTQWIMAEVARTAGAWKTSQDALRGTIPDNRESTLISSAISTGEAFSDQVQRIAAQRDSLEEQAESLRFPVEVVDEGDL